MLKSMKTLKIALTLGEPAGIGPDIVIQAAQQSATSEIVVVGSPDLLLQRAKKANVDLKLVEFDPSSPARPNGNGKLSILPIKLNKACVPGILEPANSEYVLKTLKQAYDLCAENHCDALVTGPVHKQILNQNGFHFSGHTEFFQSLAQVSQVLMVFYTPTLITGLVTTHCALQQVSALLTETRLKRAIELLYDGLKNVFHKTHPVIRICGLNPHAGEQGLLGTEEQQMMIPLIESLQSKGMKLEGPVSADTAFVKPYAQPIDAILAMYHDQGLAPMKALFFGDIVNMTLGLPFLRTSVDHGIALDLAGTTLGNPNSLIKAIQGAEQFAFHAAHSTHASA